ncbi:MAG: DUF2147 domain-containing protein [Mucilaginibacter polytrichastri]|nr:DUF2147 domain-containing protein [Mucilaginibacter polytrichastri]
MLIFRNTLLVLMIAFSLHVQAQKAEDAIQGRWLSAEKDGKIEIYKTGNTWSGRIVWMKFPKNDKGELRKDANNPDESLKSRTILNAVILTGFVYNKGAWEDGKIYDPKSGKTYSASMKLKNGKLEIRGYVGVSLLGRTTVWTKAEN